MKIHDRIVSIGQKSVVGLSFENVMGILKESKRPIKLSFISPRPVREYTFTFPAGPIGMTLGDDVNPVTGKVHSALSIYNPSANTLIPNSFFSINMR